MSEQRKKRVIIESPFQDKLSNLNYASRALLDSLLRGEAPYASHLLYPQVLDDASPEERKLGMEAGWEWMRAADLVAVYTDKGITDGMRGGIDRAKQLGLPIEYRSLEVEDGEVDGADATH
jgi:hypothetical protein